MAFPHTKIVPVHAYFALDVLRCSGLSVRINGGALITSAGFQTVTNQDLTLTASTTNYIEVSDTGVISANTTGFSLTGTYLYEITTGTAVISGVKDRRFTPTVDPTGSIAVLREAVAFGAFTDGGAAVGTYQMTGSVPAGAVLLGSKVLVPAGFAGNVSAALTIGDGTDVDRYMTGTPSVFATAATGIETGAPSGAKLIVTANRPTLTVTGNTDFTAVNAGSLDVSIYYIATV